ncbi:MAG: Bcr/CflA family efflux MFS transporter [Bacteroidia bacterium]|nr:MAG: Bcr/CflA family efflux MFS transporter [Bacteroidia bacterium]
MHTKNKFIVILTLGLLSAIGPFSIDMYLPGFDAIAKEFGTTTNQIAYTLSSFFIGISVGQLLYGPLLDKYGRKKPMYFGITLYIIASIACAFCTNVESLLVFRFFQALGGCVGMVASRAMVRDMFDVEESARIFSLLMLVLGISPIVAPTLGGYVAHYLGWQYVFYFLALLGAIIICLVFFALPETKEKDHHYSLMPKNILTQFAEVLKNKQFLTYALTGALTASALYAYIAGSPHVFMEIFKVSSKEYGLIFAVIASGLIIATQLNNVLLNHFRSYQIIPKSIIMQCVIGIILLLGFYFHLFNIYATIAACCCFLACQGLIFPNASALAIAPFSKNAGSASALLGCIQMAFGALSSGLVSYFQTGNALPMAIVMLLCVVFGFIVLSLGQFSMVKQKKMV